MVKTLSPDLRDVMLFPTAECNCRCRFCALWGQDGWMLQRQTEKVPYTKHVDFDVVRRFLEDALRTTGKRFVLELMGGEPTMYPQFAQLLSLAKHHRLPVWLFTNGTQLARYHENVVDACAVVSVSLDAPAEIHDAHRGRKNTFRDACHGLEAVIREKQRRRAMLPLLYVSCTLGEETAPHIMPLLHDLKSRFDPLGVTILYDDYRRLGEFGPNVLFFIIDPRFYMPRAVSEEYVEQMNRRFGPNLAVKRPCWTKDKVEIDLVQLKRDMAALWEELKVPASQYSEFVDVEEWWGNTTNLFGRERCISPWHSIIIKSDGNTYLCPDVEDWPLGNIHRDSFSAIWSGEKANAFRDFARDERLSMCSRACCKFFYNYDEPFRWIPLWVALQKAKYFFYSAKKKLGMSR